MVQRLKEFAGGDVLQHTIDMQIATANTRNAATWRNQGMGLAEFVAKLSHTVRTQETYDAYMAMPKPDRDQIKDVGGFVGGMLKGGRRSKGSVANRSAMTLDADYGDKGIYDAIRRTLGSYCYTVYSTHKHTEDKPRLRLVVYPDRPMLPDEYQAAMRKVADMVGINYFDDTTYGINRLMYWPSTSADGEFFFEHNDAPMLGVDKVLATYEDWRDVTQWPTSDRESKRLVTVFEKQADPLTKKGVVGAVCRTVGIREAINMVGCYTHGGGDRYTYTEGSTANGLVVYDDKFAYSNHDTDPISGMTVNAFDLLRVHWYGDFDEDAKAGTPSHRLPSWAAMREWCEDQPNIKRELVSSGLVDVDIDDFDSIGDELELPEDDGEWYKRLQVHDDGEIKTTFINATEITANDPKICNRMAYNELAMRVENRTNGELWADKDSFAVRKYIGRRYGCDFPEAKIEQAIADRAYANAFHPIQEWLETLEWDGVERLDGLFVNWLACADNVYTREAAKCFMVAAVHRAFEPGYKFDSAPVLGGAQGIGKSSIIALLAKQKWYGELSTFDHKMAAEEMQGRWIMEINEMGATNKSELEQQKAFLSGTATTVRMAYARHAVEMRRQCVFLATTNSYEYLKDSTGNRRWWPIQSGLVFGEMIDLDAFERIVDQLWAEAHTLYTLGETTLLSKEAAKIAFAESELKRESDAWEGVIHEWLEKPVDANRYSPDELSEVMETRDKVCIIEIWQDCFGMNDAPKRHEANRISAILNNHPNWDRVDNPRRFGSRFGRQKCWVSNVPF